MDIVMFDPEWESLGIPRECMPQIDRELVPEFLESLDCAKERKVMSISSIKPAQSGVLGSKVKQKTEYFLRNNRNTYTTKLYIVSKDNYLLDGHHNFVGLKLSGITEHITVTQVDMDMKELVEVALASPLSYTQSYENLVKQQTR